MTEKESLGDAIRLGFYRMTISTGDIIMTDGKSFLKPLVFAKLYQHFERVGSKAVYHLLEEIQVDEKGPFPLVKFTVDFSKPYGKIPNEPFINIAPEPSIKSENNNSDTSPIWKHIENLCGEVDDDIKEWVKDWIADIFQNPMDKKGSALTFRSAEGTGKGLFFEKLMTKLLGERNLSTSNAVFSKNFNKEIKGRLLLNLDEGSWDNSRADIGAIKKFITDKTFSIEEKFKDTEVLPNYSRLVLTSNASWIIKNDGSRRFCMLNPIKENYCSTDYFKNLNNAIDDDNICRQFLYELETRNITHDLRVIPITEEYKNQSEISHDYYASWLSEVLDTEIVPIDNDTLQLWEEFTPNVKSCLPKLAEKSFNEMMKSSITSNKLFARLKGTVYVFNYKIENILKKKDGAVFRVWEFRKAFPVTQAQVPDIIKENKVA